MLTRFISCATTNFYYLTSLISLSTNLTKHFPQLQIFFLRFLRSFQNTRYKTGFAIKVIESLCITKAVFFKKLYNLPGKFLIYLEI